MTGRRVSEPKGFQRATANAALRTLTNTDGPRRFLVADEVGLGKTIVARTIVSEMMRRRRRPLVVFYVTSNLNIAHQNRGKLLEFSPRRSSERRRRQGSVDACRESEEPPEAPQTAPLHAHAGHFGADVSAAGGFGRLEERALIFRLLSGRFSSLNSRCFTPNVRAIRLAKRAGLGHSTARIHRGSS